jgi:hypothetical protein
MGAREPLDTRFLGFVAVVFVALVAFAYTIFPKPRGALAGDSGGQR